MEQEESHETQKQVRHAKQLPLPFQPRFLLDENTASKQLQESLLARDARVLTLADFGLLCTATSDRTVSDISTAQHAWTVTRDTRFVLDALKEGSRPFHVVLVSSESTTSSIDTNDLSKIVTGECNPVSPYSATDTINVVDLRAREHFAYALPIPPDRVIQLLVVLDKNMRIDTHILAKHWGCSSARARQIAHRLRDDGWLRITKTGRSNRYYPGPSYLRMRNMLPRSPSD